jgi:hypothetical protein
MVSDIDMERARLPSQGFQLANQFLCLGSTPRIVERDIATLSAQLEADGAPNPPRATGDNSCFAQEVHESLHPISKGKRVHNPPDENRQEDKTAKKIEEVLATLPGVVFGYESKNE